MTDMLYHAATVILPVIVAIVFHEVAHGYAAWALGDPTAHERRRLSLNPLRHVDPVGTVLLPGALKLMGLPVFGWARPVPVTYARLRRPKRDMALVAAAGPATNALLAVLAAVALGLLLRWNAHGVTDDAATRFVAENLQNFVVINLFLGVFNLLPLPPFDGSRILRGVLPMAGARTLDRIEPYGIALFMGVFIVLPWLVPGLHVVDRLIAPPVDWLLERLDLLVQAVAGGASA